MPNGKKIYIHKISDPLRLAINSYWIGSEFALEKRGDPSLVDVSYGPTSLSTSGFFRQTRQEITIAETALFSIVHLNQATAPVLGATLGPASTAGVNAAAATAGKGTGGSKGAPPSTFDELASVTVAPANSNKTLTFAEYVNANFIPTFVVHSSPLINTKFGYRPEMDIVFETQTPMVTKDFSSTSNPVMGINEVKEEFLINFLEKKYEDVTSDPTVSELQLPNFYDVTYKNGPVTDTYLDDYINPLPDFTSNPAIQNYENIMIPISNYEELEKLNGYSTLFPLEIKVSPTNANVSSPLDFYNALKDSSLAATLMYFSASPFDESGDLNLNIWNISSSFDYEEIINTVTETGPGEVDIVTTKSGSTIGLDVFDLTNWSQNLIEKSKGLDISSEKLTNKIYLGPNTLSINIAENNVTDFQKILSSAIFLSKTSEVVEDNSRSFEDINTGKKSHSEIVFYKIEKYTSLAASMPIQNIWIPNINQLDPMEYVDTQVKYNKDYFYKIFAYSAVIGTKYYYDMSTFATTFDLTQFSDEYTELSNELAALREDIEDLEDDIAQLTGDLATAQQDLVDLNDELKELKNLCLDDDGKKIKKCIIPKASTDRLAEIIAKDIPLKEAHIATLADLLGQKDAELTNKKSEESLTSLSQFALLDYINKNRISNIGGGPEHFKIDVITEPIVKLIKTELFNFNGSILDDPPMIPDVKFTSYIGIDNRITINMQAQIGEYKNKPVILDPTESSYIDALKQSRGLPVDPIITYRTDDEIGGFEIYRIQTLPISYDDFSDGLIFTTSTLQRSDFHLIYSWDSSYKDTIDPNMVYYYMVRAVDIHGHKSYPSAVYKVQMVNDSGAIYPLVEVIEMKPPEKPRAKTKNFKKFIQVAPVLSQKLIDFEKSGLISPDGKLLNSAMPQKNNIVLGVEDPKVFGRTFKVRLISKQTGKKIDLNLSFGVENLD